jgi:hypothetical protein
MTMSLPDFLIIGAMKCGTSTLAAQLAAQDGLFMTTPKEPNFFSDDEVFANGLDWYERLFDAAAPGDLRGEASTHYTKLPTHPDTVPRMRAVLDAPRLVYMVRDPIDRAISHYIHEWTEGRMTDDPAGAFERHPELIEYGLYTRQLAPFIEAYGIEAICLTSLEQLKAAPQAELERVCAHIGLPATPVWREDLGAQNTSAARIRKLPLHGLLVANPIATALRRTLVPKAVRNRVRRARSYGDRPELPAALQARLAEAFAADQADLARLFPGLSLKPVQGRREEMA